MAKPLRLITDASKDLIYDHLVRLPLQDRYLRFCSALSDSAIRSYVDRLNLRTSDVAFAVFGKDQTEIIAFLHVAGPDSHNSVEFALSVDQDRRKEGLGDALFERGLLHCESMGYTGIYMSCLSTNNAIKAMARKRNMTITTDYGESMATLTGLTDKSAIAAWIAASRSDAIGLYDLQCKSMRHNWDEFISLLALGR